MKLLDAKATTSETLFLYEDSDDVKSRPMLSSARDIYRSLIDVNSFVQQVPIHEICKATGWSTKTGGLVDLAVNILPRRRNTFQSRTDEKSPTVAFTDYGRLASY